MSITETYHQITCKWLQATWAWVICTKNWKHLGRKCNHANELNITNESIFTRWEYAKHCFIMNTMNLLLKFPFLCLLRFITFFTSLARTHAHAHTRENKCTRTHTYLQSFKSMGMTHYQTVYVTRHNYFKNTKKNILCSFEGLI